MENQELNNQTATVVEPTTAAAAAVTGSPTPLNPKLQLLQEAILSGNIPQMVLNVISYALDLRSSDIHIEPETFTVRLRYRVDGVLRQIVEYPLNIHPAVVSRIKIMSNLKIDEQRIPQDGRCEVTTKDNREMDLRVSTLPTVNGEKIVMRIQDKSRKIPGLPELGLDPHNFQLLVDALDLPNGIILTTGPTGSGKTTTLYSALSRLNSVDVNILTIEDPVEIQMDGLNQSQVHPDIEYTFAYGLRTALRQDPDIIMVGEIRDQETIQTAIEASLTGHLVLSTIHTNSAIETLTRIDNLGVPPFLMASTIELIIAQRLVRRLCQKCKIVDQPEQKTLDRIKTALGNIGVAGMVTKEQIDNPVFWKGNPGGCSECDGIGYKGRVGLYEIMSMNNEIRRMILDKASALDIEKTAMKNGMVTLEQDGVLKAQQGMTSLEEIYRVAKRMEL
jgi:type IV pilus assembly protein PilB